MINTVQNCAICIATPGEVAHRKILQIEARYADQQSTQHQGATRLQLGDLWSTCPVG